MAGNASSPHGGELVQAQHARGGLLGDALNRFGDLGPLVLVGLEPLAQQVQEHLVLGRVVIVRGRHHAGLLELRTAQHQHGGVATIVQDHVGRLVRPGEHLLGRPPVLLERLALPGEDRGALRLLRGAVGADDHRGGGVVLGGENIARRPPDLSSERHQGLDQHGGLNRHMQRAGNASALERQHLRIFPAQRHQARHLVLGETDLLTAELGLGKIGHLVFNAVAYVGYQLGHRHLNQVSEACQFS